MRITEDGRITIPKKLRERLGLGDGVEVAMFPKPGTLFVRTWPPEDADPGIVEMLESRITWAHDLSDEHPDDEDACPYGVRAHMKHGGIAIPRVYRQRYELEEGAEVDILPMLNGALVHKCTPELADMKGRGELDPSVIGSAKEQGVFADLYTNTDDYINDIRGRVVGAGDKHDANNPRELPESVLGALKDQGIMGGLYDSVDDYIRDIRGHVDDGS